MSNRRRRPNRSSGANQIGRRVTSAHFSARCIETTDRGVDGGDWATPPGPMSRAMNIAALQAFPLDSVDWEPLPSCTPVPEWAPGERELVEGPAHPAHQRQRREIGHWRGHRVLRTGRNACPTQVGGIVPRWGRPPRGRQAFSPARWTEWTRAGSSIQRAGPPLGDRHDGGSLGETALSPDLRKARAARRRESGPTHRPHRPAR